MTRSRMVNIRPPSDVYDTFGRLNYKPGTRSPNSSTTRRKTFSTSGKRSLADKTSPLCFTSQLNTTVPAQVFA